MGLCAHKDIKVIFSWVYSILRIDVKCFDPNPYDAWAGRVLRFSCVKFGPHRIIENKLVWVFVAHFCHLLFHAIKGWSCCPKCIPYTDLFFLYRTVMIYFIFFPARLYNVFFSNTQSMHLRAFQLIKTTNQSVTPWENSPGWSRQNTHDKLPLWSGAPSCLGPQSLLHCTDSVSVCVCLVHTAFLVCSFVLVT